MADPKDKSQKDPKKREELEQARRDKIPAKQVPYENRQLTPGRDGRTITR